jgi:hypothetical protein
MHPCVGFRNPDFGQKLDRTSARLPPRETQIERQDLLDLEADRENRIRVEGD